MKRIPKQKRSLMKYEALLRAALMEFSEKGYTETTSKSIAARAKVATGSFYQYFEDKNDILYCLVRNRFDQLKSRYFELSERTPDKYDDLKYLRENIGQILNVMIGFHEEMSSFHGLIHHRRHIDPELDSIIRDFDQAFDQRISQLVGLYKPNTARTSSFVVKAIAEGVVHGFVFDRPDGLEKDAVIEQGVSAILNYLTSGDWT